jgi:hypothetical protein
VTDLPEKIEKPRETSEAKTFEDSFTPAGIKSMQGEVGGAPSNEKTKDVPSAITEMDSTFPPQKDILPDGIVVDVFGNIEEYKKFNHLQGDNDHGYKNTCGVVSCENVLNQFNRNINENELVNHAYENGLCDKDNPNIEKNGGTSPADQAKILTDHGVPAQVKSNSNLDELALDLEENKGVIMEANAGVLWNDPDYFDNGEFNHAVTPIGFAKDIASGEIRGFYINDSGSGESGKFIDSNSMHRAWVSKGGVKVVTDHAHS